MGAAVALLALPALRARDGIREGWLVVIADAVSVVAEMQSIGSPGPRQPPSLGLARDFAGQLRLKAQCE